MRFFISAIFVTASLFTTLTTNAAVILQYHHVSSETPASTSIDPAQFEAHMRYLKNHQFQVVPLNTIIDAIKAQQPLDDKLVAITFDDAYINNLTIAKPILDKFGYNFTIFVNPGIINRNSHSYLSWQQLKALADEGVLIANHGYEHDSMARTPEGLTTQAWLAQRSKSLLKAEKIIEQKTGQSWRYFAYPYGEYTQEVQAWVKQNNFVAFSQQSGAFGLATDLSIVPRFPASKPYDKLTSLKDKLNSLPLNLEPQGEGKRTLFNYNEAKEIHFSFNNQDFNQNQLNCYISGLGKQEITWHDEQNFTIKFSENLKPGRVRANCTAPSKSKPGRYYWYSKPWFVLNEDGSWYHL